MTARNIEDYERDYREGCGVQDVRSLAPAKALIAIGKLINASTALQRPAGFTHGISLGEQMLEQGALNAPQTALLHSFLANAWSGLRRRRGLWVWDSHELAREILELRKAVAHKGFQQLDKKAQCPILTNLGNVLSAVGRIVEALPLWNRALSLIPDFGMALANRGEGLISYARALSWSTQRNAFLEASLADLRSALSAKGHPIEPEAISHFESLYRRALEAFSRIAKGHMHRPKRLTMGKSGAERRYRLWSLRNCLFLNPLNDLTIASPAGSDLLSCPPVIVGLDDAPYFVAAFDQLKQEFVSARYLYYDGLSGKRPTFSDRLVRLHNTMDYPAYGLRTEEQKSAYRAAHSIFDKSALFLNAYMALGIEPERVSFRKVWYEHGDLTKRRLAVDLADRANWPLRGLFWLSKDLLEEQVFGDVLEPDAQGLHEIRNYLEHRFLRLKLEPWASMPGDIPNGLIKSVAATEFAAKTLKILKLARAALIYLALSVWREEQVRLKSKPDARMLHDKLDVWEDEWKR